MFKEVRVKFSEEYRTTITVLKRKPKTKKKRILKKWFKKFSVTIPDVKGCDITGYETKDGKMVVHVTAHPMAKPYMEKMNSMNDGNQPFFTWE